MSQLDAEEHVNSVDRMIAAYLGRLTFGLSPAVLVLAYLDWLVHFGFAPGKQAELAEKWLRKMLRFAVYARQAAMDPNTRPCIEPLPQDSALQDGRPRTNHRRVVDGPLAFNNAISEEAAQIKPIVSPVAGRADILLVPDLEAGNMLVKQLGYLAEAQGAGVVLGARVPWRRTSGTAAACAPCGTGRVSRRQWVSRRWKGCRWGHAPVRSIRVSSSICSPNAG